ncbi:Acyl dehydratase [Pseudonocardia thermophila]|jgi:Acyl dehydratase|uniref:Acyl dehydratase n=1 Tax=Pseudonocardia thermophila TaxID=1848 RepID=A0A1M6VGN8_PSETH|nr:MaoC/PaaZ C-terminal domain-containing protein [Pseudonocardia thermophila]SHK80630.1 Acyl dehydratase [Pseudonocardia thermophila]
MSLGVSVGETVRFRKTVTESDVGLFAGITGDFAPNHVDEEYMRTTPYGTRIAHGVLVLGLASTASTILAGRIPGTTVSAGYDRVRFTGPVRIGDTVTIDYTVESIDEERRRVRAAVRGATQDGTTCLVATHILAVVADS